MRLGPFGIAALLLLGLGHPASAQHAVPERAEAAATTRPNVDVGQLPISLSRINRGLRQTSEREERDGMKLRYSIDVYGSAPPIDVLNPKQDNLLYGPVPYGGPTHQQMLQIMTPQEFRAPAADFSGLIRWLADKSKNK